MSYSVTLSHRRLRRIAEAAAIGASAGAIAHALKLSLPNVEGALADLEALASTGKPQDEGARK